MEEVDKILIHSLRQAGTAVPPEVQSVRDLTPELVVEAAVRCLRAVRPALGAPLSPLLPPGISARFRLASDLAAACQELGFGGDVGYQTFLYSSEHDTRRLLLFLVEKLPRDEGERGAEPPGKSGALLRAIGAQIREQLGTPWVPPVCRTARLQRLQGTSHLQPFAACPLVLPQSGGSPELQEYFGGAAPPVPAQPPLSSQTPPALLETHTAQLSAHHDWEAEWGGPGLASRLPPQEYLGRKRLRARLRALEPLRQACPPCPQGPSPGPPLDPAWLQEAFGAGGAGGALPKGSRFTRTQHLTHEQDPQVLLQQLQAAAETLQPPKGPEEEPGSRQASEEAALEETLARLEAEIEGCRGEIRAAQLSLTQAEAEVQQGRRALGGREDALRVKARALELLPDAQNNMAKLQLVVESSSRRIVSLAGQWERHRGPLLAEFRHLRALRDSAQRESSRRLAETQALLQRSRAAAEEARRKETLHAQLVAELEALPRDVSRAVYTQRILEIVGNIRKQKEEIGKILEDTRALQKEINALVGKLERTFSVTDELLFKDAKRDEVVRKAYKYLAALHENCAQLIRTIEDTGTIQREIRDLEEQIEGETSAKLPASLERILSDCRALREENALLAARARHA
ncbi:LOW QUALITY PROTEIN: coiled-coil domain-containing protein 22 [Corvus hawaiiensis]|uniref:LOW QUALITY PROTEIN: coiled-coil domain-containing protein 22 n=1 Tax=Corvus hawaiiensis TaxID=134902 RepID=UPI002019349F|nr:LOW QUALITY PROTEIN: coiled-coil domain-containing protein 22 [Corvus hawaiiensis]